jgi:hypothetical protein
MDSLFPTCPDAAAYHTARIGGEKNIVSPLSERTNEIVVALRRIVPYSKGFCWQRSDRATYQEPNWDRKICGMDFSLLLVSLDAAPMRCGAASVFKSGVVDHGWCCVRLFYTIIISMMNNIEKLNQILGKIRFTIRLSLVRIVGRVSTTTIM